MPAHGNPLRRESWHSQPVVWLGLTVLAASLAGCIWLIVAGAQFDDAPVATGRQVFGVPTQQPVPPPP